MNERLPSERLPAAVLWDFDGTLVDTEPTWIGTEYALTAELGGAWTEELSHQLIGCALLDAGRAIRRAAGREDLTDAEVTDLLVERVIAALADGAIAWRPGARALVTEFARAEIPCALVTASYRRLVDTVLGRFDHPFEVIVAGDEVRHGKPHPEPYLTAAARLGVRAEECLVLEDSPTGAASGNAAGCVVAVIPSLIPVPAAARRFQLDTLEGVGVEDLRNQLRAEPVR